MINAREPSYAYYPDGRLKYSIGMAFKKEYEEAMDLAWVTFSEYVAPGYPQEGINSFRDFICDPVLFRMFERGEYQMFLARSNKSIIGLGTLRNGNQISLLFVDRKCHKNGVGQSLVDCLSREVKEKRYANIVVNSSPYAINFYHKIGFKDSSPVLMIDGIIFTPMAKLL